MPDQRSFRPSILFIDSAYTLKAARRKGLLDFFRSRSASGYFWRVVSVHPLADLADGAKSVGIKFFRLERRHLLVEGASGRAGIKALFPLRFVRNQFLLLRTLLRLSRKDCGLSLVMAADPFYSALLGLLVARFRCLPFAIRLGGNSDEIYEATGVLAMPRLLPTIGIQRAVQRFVLRRADLVVGINPNNLNFGIVNGARRQTAVLPISSGIARLHLTAPEERCAGRLLRARLGIATDVVLLLYVGRLIALKHPEDAVVAMLEATKLNPQAVGIVVGEGSEEASLRAMVADSRTSAVHFAGTLGQDELSQLFPGSIIISPSAGQMALLEAALGGAAIVTYARDFQQHFIEDGVNGVKVPYRDTAALVEATVRLTDDPDRRARLGAAARRSALEVVNPNHVAKIEHAIFERLLEG